MKIIDTFRDSTVYHIRCDCGFDFNHVMPSGGWECSCTVCSSKESLRSLLERQEQEWTARQLKS